MHAAPSAPLADIAYSALPDYWATAAWPHPAARHFEGLARLRIAVALSDIDREGCPVLFANAAFGRLSGVALPAVVGRSLLALYAEAGQRVLMDARGAALDRPGSAVHRALPGRAPGEEEHIFQMQLTVPGFEGVLASSHVRVGRARYRDGLADPLRNAELAGRNALRAVSSAATIAWVRARAARRPLAPTTGAVCAAAAVRGPVPA